MKGLLLGDRARAGVTRGVRSRVGWGDGEGGGNAAPITSPCPPPPLTDAS